MNVTSVFKKNLIAYNKGFRYIINQGGTSCFHPETLIVCQSGNKKIKDIKTGDIVLTYNETTHQQEWHVVKNLFKYQNYKLTIKVLLRNGFSFVSTADHRFYFNGKWIPIINLAQINYQYFVDYEYIDVPVVYDIEVENNHNYYIHAGDNILVHNSSKTYSILQCLFFIAAKSQKPLLISVVSESLPHLRRGAMKDFEDILTGEGLNIDSIRNKSTQSYLIGRSKVEFFGMDEPRKAHGSRRDILFVNEANSTRIGYDVFDQLAVRTKRCVFIDYNPTSKFWCHDELIPMSNSHFIKSTYLDNEFLSPEIIKAIEEKKDRINKKNWWLVYGLGETGIAEGLVINEFHKIDKFPDHVSRIYYGLDFGFSNDPTAVSIVGIDGRNLYLNELVYRTELRQSELINLFKTHGVRMRHDEIFADRSRPDLIDNLNTAGFNVKGAKNDILQGIEMMLDFEIYVVETATNLISELENYTYVKDINGQPTNKPIDAFNHLIDGIRYVILERANTPVIRAGVLH